MEAQSELRQRFRGIVALYAGAIRRLAAVYVPNAADRDDLFQEILLAVWQALPAFRGDASERTWLYRIAHNVALTHQRKNRRASDRECGQTSKNPSLVGQVPEGRTFFHGVHQRSNDGFRDGTR